MFKTLLSSIGFAFVLSATAQSTGDTLVVNSHQGTHMNWFGNFNEETTFPTTGEFKKIIMEYRLSCPTGGCSDWDYTTQMNLINPTGMMDSNLVSNPTFTVNGSQVDSLSYNIDATYSTSYNSGTMATDTVQNPSMEVIIYGDEDNPTTATDTIYVFTGGYYNYDYDVDGNTTDSSYVNLTDTMYLDHYEYYNVFEVMQTIELGRAITPYANDFSQTWERVFYYDITEFSSLLQGTKTVQAHYSGWSDGFSADINFHFIYGTPPRDLVEFIPLWHGSFGYGQHEDGVHTIENRVNQKTYSGAGVSHSELVFTPTGHGSDNQGCSEFCSKYFTVKANGLQVGQQSIWKDDCGANALYPQPGTWLYDRANWCPGEQTPKFRFDLTSNLTAGENTVDVDFQDYNSSGGASYTVDGYVATYGDFNFTNNIAITDILAPTSKFDHSRFNPHCGKPQIEVQNLGGENLTSFNVGYGVEGVSWRYYTWEGTLAPLDKIAIELPEMNPFDMAVVDFNTFSVKVSSPNGASDEDLTDNELSSTFENIKDFPTEFIIKFKANSQPNQNAWNIKNVSGDVLFSESGFVANATSETTITLEPGCYVFTLTDSERNGLNFWANNDGNGLIQFRKSGGGVHKTFNANFGSSIVYPFTVGVPLNIEEVDQVIDFNLTPNPSSGIVNLEFSEQTEVDYIQVVNTLGQTVLQLNTLGFIDEKALDLSHLTDGIYHVTIQTATQQYAERIVLQN